jgi:hypothetical protein
MRPEARERSAVDSRSPDSRFGGRPPMTPESAELVFVSRPPDAGRLSLEAIPAFLGLIGALREGDARFILLATLTAALMVTDFFRRRRLRLLVDGDGLLLERGVTNRMLRWGDVALVLEHRFSKILTLYRNAKEKLELTLSEFRDPEELRGAVLSRTRCLEPVTVPEPGAAAGAGMLVTIVGLSTAVVLVVTHSFLELTGLAMGVAAGVAAGLVLAFAIRLRLEGWRAVGWACVVLMALTGIVALIWVSSVLYRATELAVGRVALVIVGAIAGVSLVQCIAVLRLHSLLVRDAVARYLSKARNGRSL